MAWDSSLGISRAGHVLAVFAAAAPSTACKNPAREAGTILYNADHHVLQFCNGEEWLAAGPVDPPGTGGGGCATATMGIKPEGFLFFNTDFAVLQYCDGVTWRAVGLLVDPCEDSPDPGARCFDGSIYAGLSPDGIVPMYTTPGDAPSTYTWNNGTADFTSTMTNCHEETPGMAVVCRTGKANTALLAELADEGSPYSAASYCDGLSAYGHGDWYLPAQDELYVLWDNRNAGALSGTFDTSGADPAGFYWSSSERQSALARRQRFSDGLQDSQAKNETMRIRCVRKQP